ncbi:uncharacterized protein LOC103575148 isoform X2 [Microplitis demolitor]|uniref:uncharacterized protein LOC103575148 isoform X2 n=1 Tax=Microplitis demolitor TaxID=69319 RepID=UPI0004CCD0C0|nr:uncharacterized protein LOC103575148 isoform X2 [Microplitis demolitor]
MKGFLIHNTTIHEKPDRIPNRSRYYNFGTVVLLDAQKSRMRDEVKDETAFGNISRMPGESNGLNATEKQRLLKIKEYLVNNFTGFSGNINNASKSDDFKNILRH